MGKILIPLLILLALPWAISTWWTARRARSERERSFISRTSMGIWMFLMFGVMGISLLKGQAQLFGLALLGATGFAIRHGWRKARARIQAEERDPLSRARRIN